MRRIFAIVAVAGLAISEAGAQDKKTGDKPAATGPFELPALPLVKEKCKTNEGQNGRLETVYKTAQDREAEIRKTAKDNGSDKKDLDKFLSLGKVETINKVKEVLDKDQKKTFDQLVAATSPAKKKK